MIPASPIADSALSLLDAFGLPALFVLFVIKGAIVGKPVPTSVVLPGYLVAVSASTRLITAAIAVASVGYVVGQLLIYIAARRYDIDMIRSVPLVSVSDAQLDRADRLFERYSGAGVFVTNLVPYVGTFIVIPAGMARYPLGRLTAYALVSTVLNYVIIVLVALESIAFLTGL